MDRYLTYGLFVLLPLFITYAAHSQPELPEPGMLYMDDIVPRVDILIHPDSLDLIYDDPESNHEYPATFIYNNGIVLDTVFEVGFRLRGNTSRWSQKKSFKVAINSFYPGRKYCGVEKINLNGEHNDPSIIRSKLCWDMLRKLDIPAPRSNHVELYINGNYHGLYINVEHIDEEFVKSRFGNNDGNLFKCLWPADLDYLGDDPDLYKFDNWGRRVYALKTNEELDDYSDIAHFIDILNNIAVDELPDELEKVFNVYDYLKIIAVDVATANWDGYIYNKNNFYLYHNTSTGKFEYVPYDLDNTFGIDWFGIEWWERNIYEWGQYPEPRPLYDRLLDVQRYRDVYSYYVKILTEEILNSSTYFPEIRSIRDKIYPYVIDDPYYPLDYGYDADDFIDSYTQAMGNHVPIGLEPYISTRNDETLNQLVVNDIAPVVKYPAHTAAVVNLEIWFKVYAEDDHEIAEVLLEMTPEGSSLQSLEMFDDGMHHDGEAGDHIYGISAGIFNSPVNLLVNYAATDDLQQTKYYTQDPMLVVVGEPVIPALFINEFMADNETIKADEHGDYNDWLELYNGGGEPVWLGDLFLTDNLGNPDKWQMPDYTLDPGAFILIWADDETGQGMFHANFKLSKDGEEIGIYGPEEMGYPVIDNIIYEVQEEDISFGRQTDGGNPWKFMDYATPGYSNTSGASIGENVVRSKLEFYPNPCTSGLIQLEVKSDIRIYDFTGNLCLTVSDVDQVDISSLPSGQYFLVNDLYQSGRLIIIN